MFHVEHWHRNSMCHVAHSSHCQCSTWNIDIPRQAGRVGRCGHEVGALQQVGKGRIRNSRPARQLGVSRTLVFSVMLHFVAFSCIRKRPRTAHPWASPASETAKVRFLKNILAFPAPQCIIPNNCHPVKRVFRCKPVAAAGVNVTRKEACDSDRRPAAPTTSPALARAALNRCGASPDRAFGGFAARVAKRRARRPTPGPADTYADPTPP